ncbi:MAG: thioredoxin family protein [Firmicutes bacterium]|nr:thioredoxin family protein [Bacillota bacterium]
MLIKVIGSEGSCDSCETTMENLKIAVAEMGLDAQIEKITDLVEIVKLGIMTAPAILIDDLVLFPGQVPSVKQIKKTLAKLV